MDKIGYIKKEIPKIEFYEIDKIFTEKTAEESYTSACIPIYRDILIFKNDKKNNWNCKDLFWVPTTLDNWNQY